MARQISLTATPRAHDHLHRSWTSLQRDDVHDGRIHERGQRERRRELRRKHWNRWEVHAGFARPLQLDRGLQRRLAEHEERGGACGDANEGNVIISLQPTIATAQWVYPNDEATLNVLTGGGDLAGSVKFSLYNNSGCSGSVLYEETRTIPAAAGLNEVLQTTNGDGVGTGDAADEKVSANGTYSWLVVFTSTNPAHKNATSVCHDEHFGITFVNDDPGIPAP